MKKLLYLISSLVALTLVSCEKETLPENVVDLGLSVKWSTINVGAINPEDYGYYFAWGEIHQNENCNWETYKWFNKDDKSLTKYCVSSESGTVDNKTVLDMEDDAAHMHWGSAWRTPTKEELEDLRNQCSWAWETKNGVAGFRVIGPNGNSIFLPAAGYRDNTNTIASETIGRYMSSSLDTVFSSNMSFLSFVSDDVQISSDYRCFGFVIRPVFDN